MPNSQQISLEQQRVLFAEYFASSLGRDPAGMLAFVQENLPNLYDTRIAFKSDIGGLFQHVGIRMYHSYMQEYRKAALAGSRDWFAFQRESENFGFLDDEQVLQRFPASIIQDPKLFYEWVNNTRGINTHRLALIYNVPRAGLDEVLARGEALYFASIPLDVPVQPEYTVDYRQVTLPNGIILDMSHPTDGNDWALTDEGWMPLRALPIGLTVYYTDSGGWTGAPLPMTGEIVTYNADYSDNITVTATNTGGMTDAQINAYIVAFVLENITNPALVVSTAQYYGYGPERLLTAGVDAGYPLTAQAMHEYWVMGTNGVTSWVPPWMASAQGEVNLSDDERIALFVATNLRNPALVIGTALQYDISPERLAQATGYTLEQVRAYWALGVQGIRDWEPTTDFQTEAPHTASDEDVIAFIQDNYSNPAYVIQLCTYYSVTPERAARLLGQSLADVRRYWQLGLDGVTSFDPANPPWAVPATASDGNTAALKWALAALSIASLLK